MRVYYDRGICLQDGIKEIVMDPHAQTQGSIVSHAHMDHLSRGALMTPETLAVMKVRLGGGAGKPLRIGGSEKYGGFEVKFHDAGHTFGSAMVEAGDALYTGDFNPEGGLTCGVAVPRPCRTLIVESTYGRPQFSLPPKREVEKDVLSWAESQLATRSVAFGAIEFGKAQELVALLNTIKVEPVVSDRMADIADIYVAHGHRLNYRRMGEMTKEEKKEARAYVVSRNWLGAGAPEEFSSFRENGGSRAYVSGWCGVFNFTHGGELDAQFPLTDHADFDDLLDFVAACKPRQVYTVGSSAQELAREIASRLKIKAESLQQRRRRKDEVGR
jgi:Cft2 family RNA processing exonuclease